MKLSGDQIVAMLEEVRQKSRDNFIQSSDWDLLIYTLKMAFCDHEMHTWTVMGDPDEVITNCKKCGYAPTERYT